MRYTLRLLTLDQLSRAAGVVCALELMRSDPTTSTGATAARRLADRDRPVGRLAPPRRTGWAARATTDQTPPSTACARYKTTAGQAAPAPLKACPWCGDAVHAGQLPCMPNETRAAQPCDPLRQPACDFTRDRRCRSLTVDEPIYRRLPAFLIATVDKFAGLPWVGEAAPSSAMSTATTEHGLLRRRASRARGRPLGNGARARPPDLIIQDELHLISGPLGTMAGLYETAIDRLASRGSGGKRDPAEDRRLDRDRPPRRASRSRRCSTGRDTAVFPPPGSTARDSFFAKTVPSARSRRASISASPPRAAGRSSSSCARCTTLLAGAQAKRTRRRRRRAAIPPTPT